MRTATARAATRRTRGAAAQAPLQHAVRARAPRAGAAPRRLERRAGRQAARVGRVRHALRRGRLDDARSGISPTSSLAPTSTPRSGASWIRRTTSASGVASTSITLTETWTRPLPGRSSPSACTPGRPPLEAAHRRGDRLRVLEAARRELDVERDQQPPGADQHAACRGSSRRGPKSGCSSPTSMRRCSSAGPPRRKNAGRSPRRTRP